MGSWGLVIDLSTGQGYDGQWAGSSHSSRHAQPSGGNGHVGEQHNAVYRFDWSGSNHPTTGTIYKVTITVSDSNTIYAGASQCFRKCDAKGISYDNASSNTRSYDVLGYVDVDEHGIYCGVFSMGHSAYIDLPPGAPAWDVGASVSASCSSPVAV